MYFLNRQRRRNKQNPLLADLVESKKRILEKKLPNSAFKSAYRGGKKNRKNKPRESKADL